MKKFKSAVLSILIVASTLVLSLSQAQATPILITDNNQLLGANGINIDGSFFDVRFVDGTCADVFGGICSRNNFTFQTQAEAFAAAAALLNQVFGSTAGNPFDIDPELTFGCSNTIVCQILIPTNIFPGLLLANAIAQNNNGIGTSSGSTVNIRTTDNLASQASRVFASFTPSVSASVPEPSALVILLSGLLGLLIMHKRRYRSH
jgi:hypothetical protein